MAHREAVRGVHTIRPNWLVLVQGDDWRSAMQIPFRYFNNSSEVICRAVMMYIRYPLSLRHLEDWLFERGIDMCRETARFWWGRFGPMFAAEIRKRRVQHRSHSLWRWHHRERRTAGTKGYNLSDIEKRDLMLVRQYGGDVRDGDETGFG